MQQDYTNFVDRMIDKYEGGYCWDRSDPGGPTKYGITCFDLAQHRGQKMTSMATWAPLVKAMLRSEAEMIYMKKYAAPIRFNDLSVGVDCVMFDYGVNSGVSRPIRVACALLKQPASGVMTSSLLTAIRTADPVWFIRSMNEERLHFMHQIRGGSAWVTFGKGWGARVSDLSRYCIALASGAVVTPPAQTDPSTPTPKATHDDPGTNTKAGGGAGAGATAVAGAHFLGLPVWVLVVAGVVVIAGVVAYLVWKQAQADKLNRTVVLPPGVVPRGA